MQTFAQVLFRLRDSRGLTQTQLGELSGVSVSWISRAESGSETKVRKSNARKVFEALYRVSPLSNEEVVAYTNSIGLTGLTTVRPLPRRRQTQASLLDLDSRGAIGEHWLDQPPIPGAMDDDQAVRQRVLTTADLLYANEPHPGALLAFFQSLCRKWGVQLPPPLGVGDPPPYVVFETIEDGHRVREHVPTRPPMAPMRGNPDIPGAANIAAVKPEDMAALKRPFKTQPPAAQPSKAHRKSG